MNTISSLVGWCLASFFEVVQLIQCFSVQAFCVEWDLCLRSGIFMVGFNYTQFLGGVRPLGVDTIGICIELYVNV